MASESIHPLRISKSSSGSSPSKMAGNVPRPLSEISPTEQRRNSPSWRHSTTSPKKSALNTDSSPFQSSPLESVTSPRMFWQNRNSENLLYGSGSPSSNRRTSIERLQRASRVKNSNILALEQKQEYDPTRLPHIERPLAKVQRSGLGTSSSGLRSSDYSDQSSFDLSRSDSFSGSVISHKSSMTVTATSTPPTPSKEQGSPTKSSLSPSKFKSSYDHDAGFWSGENSISEHEVAGGRTLHRNMKSVTFDAAPPQVNEYEMATPDLSSVGTNSREGSYESFDDEEDSVLYDPAHGDLHEDSFDASLEDTDKTPVVGPDDWRGDSPHYHQRRRYDGSPMPDATPTMNGSGHATAKRSDSANSNSDHRPLPPLPGAGFSQSQSSNSGPGSPSLGSPAEKMTGSHRNLPSPPPAMASKSDIQNIGNGKMSLEERLRLMMLSDDANGKSAAEQQRERRLRRANGREKFSSPVSEADSHVDPIEPQEDETIGDISGLDDYQLPTRISRESIMRRVNGNKAFDRESDYNFSSPAPSSSPHRSPTRSPERFMSLDPDVPIPSTEDPTLGEIQEEEEEGSVIITRNEDDYEPCDLSEVYPRSEAEFEEDAEEDRLHQHQDDDDDGSHYSDQHDAAKAQKQEKSGEEEIMTPRASPPAQATGLGGSLPDLGPKHAAFSQDFEAYMLPQTHQDEEKFGDVASKVSTEQRPHTPEQAMSKPEYDGSGWGEPEDSEDDEPGTPDSVIHHPATEKEEEEREPPSIPEQLATIKSASGSKLKTRVSGTPADLAAMREARRQVSREVPDVPPIPAKHRNRLSRDMGTAEAEAEATGDDFLERHPSFKNRSLTLDLDLGLSLDQDFERVIEAQKVAFHDSFVQTSLSTRHLSGQVSGQPCDEQSENSLANSASKHQRGYLMRQNTKVVTATDKEADESWKARSAGNSPVKRDNRPQSWIVEPWNGKMRQKSVRRRSSIGVQSGPVPPMPGQQSNATATTALQQVTEEDINAEIATPESGERGRLFVKVLGVKDLDLPVPKNERTWFSLTLDNGVHCVTTAWLELARNAPIGQEFELVVPNDLEFQLTLNVKLDKPAPIKLDPTSAKTSKPKGSTFSRVFASPKKRKELEIRQKEEEERLAQQKSAQARQRNSPPTAYELLSPLAAEDGSFGRSYICLKEHENRCFGRPYLAEVACFNEWATEEAGFASSVKSKRGNTAVVRRAPYKVGKLEVQLLFVPRPKNSTDDDMPKSMNSCIRELKATEERLSRNFEGHLSQQGGDCPYWRRRYFKLAGTKLTAYHEATRQPRATINLSNAKRLIDDRRALTEKETMGRGGKRRRSAFAEEEEGYMFVEEGFRIRFNNGEVIDFYADTAEDKDSWMKVLTDVIGRGDGNDEDSNGLRSRAKWCELVLKREDQLRRRAEGRAEGRRVHSRTKSMYV